MDPSVQRCKSRHVLLLYFYYLWLVILKGGDDRIGVQWRWNAGEEEEEHTYVGVPPSIIPCNSAAAAPYHCL
jgi:hypothetical protein